MGKRNCINYSTSLRGVFLQTFKTNYIILLENRKSKELLHKNSPNVHITSYLISTIFRLIQNYFLLTYFIYYKFRLIKIIPTYVPSSWTGYLWARTSCALDSGAFTCATGDCGSGKLECAGSEATQPVSLAEFALNDHSGLDLYDINLVGGFNVPITVEPRGGKFGNCTTAGCATDLNEECPKELGVVGTSGTVACKSACKAFGDPIFCCEGAYATPDTCKPTMYSEYFKRGCPMDHSYALGDPARTFNYGGASEYVITFCHSPTVSGNPAAGNQVPADPKVGSTSDSTVP
ncbi:thaumatin-like protein 1b [Apium graveolens]|uniref:thaumatin-like protein 1b n=1 Tax=Apium graveolens TaxID=4045 RepID=UPI003D791D2A